MKVRDGEFQVGYDFRVEDSVIHPVVHFWAEDGSAYVSIHLTPEEALSLAELLHEAAEKSVPHVENIRRKVTEYDKRRESKLGGADYMREGGEREEL